MNRFVGRGGFELSLVVVAVRTTAEFLGIEVEATRAGPGECKMFAGEGVRIRPLEDQNSTEVDK